jgi:hypothetical protein
MDDWDKDIEKIDIDTLLKSMDRYIKSGGPMSWNHGNYTIGHIWGYEPFEKDGMKGMKVYGNLFGGDKGIYDKVREMFVKGANSVSVAGESDTKRYECTNNTCGFRRSVSELMEIALCKVPANKHAVMLSYNEKAANTFSKSDDSIVKFNELQIHRDETTCPILKLRKALRDHGIDAHARSDGVFVAMDSATFAKALGRFDEADLTAKWVSGGVLLQDRDYIIEKTFREGFAKGYIDKNGVFTDDVDMDFFCESVDAGVVCREDGEFRLKDPSAAEFTG